MNNPILASACTPVLTPLLTRALPLITITHTPVPAAVVVGGTRHWSDPLGLNALQHLELDSLGASLPTILFEIEPYPSTPHVDVHALWQAVVKDLTPPKKPKINQQQLLQHLVGGNRNSRPYKR